MAASRVLESMDRSVNPCEDFYTYACGNWKKTHVIPEDRSSLNVFGVLRDQVQVINKSKYARVFLFPRVADCQLVEAPPVPSVM